MGETRDLRQLQQEAAEIKSLECKLRELQEQARHFEGEVIALKTAFSKECADISKLEGRSIANYVYQVLGKLDDKLDKERQEAYGAKVKLDGAELELQGIRRDISDLQSRISAARTAEYLLQQELKYRQTELKSSDTEAGRQIQALEEKTAGLEVQKKEIREAVSAGYRAKSNCDRILNELDSADGWNTWDLIGGGGLLTHVAKHSHLDEAQDMLYQLQTNLRQFQTELADIRIHMDAKVNVDGFLRFADYFFDGLFADFAMKEKIERSQGSVSHTKRQIIRALEQLEELEKNTDRELANLKKELDDLTVSA